MEDITKYMKKVKETGNFFIVLGFLTITSIITSFTIPNNVIIIYFSSLFQIFSIIATIILLLAGAKLIKSESSKRLLEIIIKIIVAGLIILITYITILNYYIAESIIIVLALFVLVLSIINLTIATFIIVGLNILRVGRELNCLSLTLGGLFLALIPMPLVMIGVAEIFIRIPNTIATSSLRLIPLIIGISMTLIGKALVDNKYILDITRIMYINFEQL